MAKGPNPDGAFDNAATFGGGPSSEDGGLGEGGDGSLGAVLHLSLPQTL